MKLKKSVWIPTVLCAAVAGTSSYVTFSDDSPVFRSYFINEYAVATADAHEELLEKDAVLTSTAVQTVTANATEIDEILVGRGSSVTAGEELLTLRTDAAEREYERLEIQAEAFEDELSALQSIANSIGSTGAATPKGDLKLSEIGDEISVDLALEVVLSESPTEAAAIIDQRMIEVQRELDVVESYLAMADGEAALISPIDGTITDIKNEAGFVTIELYADEQQYVTFVSDSEWQRLAEGQAATIKANLEDEELEDEVTGMVVTKHKVPASDSPEYKQIQKLDAYKDRTLYEVAIQTDSMLEPLPFGSFAEANIVLNEELFAYKLPLSWVAPPPASTGDPLENAVDETIDAAEETDAVTSDETVDIMLDDATTEDATFYGDENVYTLGYDGRVRLNPIDVSFTTGDSAVTPTDLVEGTVLLNATERSIYAETFLTMPTRKLDLYELKQLTWEDYVKYLLF